jgi:prophage tail gpP-like protein
MGAGGAPWGKDGWPRLVETAVLTVNGMDFRDWESVSVKHAMRDRPPYLCRFTCSEGLPIAGNLTKMQIKPGMDCTVTLAGILAFTGKVMTRQVYYDATRHHIEIQAGTFDELNTASVISKTMEWKDKTFQQIGNDILKNFNLQMKFEGGSPPDQKFPRASAMHGEAVQDFLDRLARSLKTEAGTSIKFTSNPNGEYVVVVGPGDGSDSVTEGKDIIIGREIIYNPAMATYHPAIAQGPSSDKKFGAPNYSGPFNQQAMQSFAGFMPPGTIVSEIPTSDKQVVGNRASTETKWLGEDQITVNATVYGWIRPSGGLWQRNQKVRVYSPMLMMHGDELEAKSVVFTQDNKTGTRTTLELCNAEALKQNNPSIAKA